MDGGVKMKEHEKQNLDEKKDNNQIEEIDPDYITGGATVAEQKDIEGLTPTKNTQVCECGEFSPNDSGKCGPPICENCIHAKKKNADSSTTYCEKQFITIS